MTKPGIGKSPLSNLWVKITAVLGGLAVITTAIANLERGWQTVARLFTVRNGDSGGISVRARLFPVMPLSLKNSVGSRDSLYWFYIDAANRGREPAMLNVSFTVRDGPAEKETAPFSTTIPARGAIQRSVNPAFVLTNYDIEANLDVRWTVSLEGSQGKPLYGDTSVIHLLPRNVIAWDLSSPDKRPIPKELILASLAAWVRRTPAGEIRKEAVRLRTAAGPAGEQAEFVRNWFGEAYERLFRGSGKLTVTAMMDSFPPAGKQVVRLPEQVLAAGKADRLEAAVLLASLASAVDDDLRARILLVSHAETFYLCWRSRDASAWEGIDIGRVDDSGFTANLAATRARLQALWIQEPAVLSALDAAGVYLRANKGMAAIDFGRSAEKFGIFGLP